MSEYEEKIIRLMVQEGGKLLSKIERLQAENIKLHEKIVLCKDCKRFSLDNSDHDYRNGWWCHRWNTDMVNPDGFCAWSERRNT